MLENRIRTINNFLKTFQVFYQISKTNRFDVHLNSTMAFKPSITSKFKSIITAEFYHAQSPHRGISPDIVNRVCLSKYTRLRVCVCQS